MGKKPADEAVRERYTLVMERIASIPEENTVEEPYRDYFRRVASFIVMTGDFIRKNEAGEMENASLAEWQSWNARFYEDIVGTRYDNSYACPKYCCGCFGSGSEDMARALSFLYAEVRTIVWPAHEDDLEAVTAPVELFAEIYGIFENDGPDYGAVKDAVYWYASDYAELFLGERIMGQIDPSRDFAVRVLERSGTGADFTYLYRYGEYVAPSDLEMARFIERLPEDEIARIASVYSEGYRTGFVKAKKDLSRKKTVDVRYRIGFERVIKQAVQNFREMGLEPTVRRTSCGIVTKRSEPYRIGYSGTSPNKQYDYDHRQDQALFLDRKYVSRKLEVMKHTFEEHKDMARGMAGPACVEFFGEKPFSPRTEECDARFDDDQQKIEVLYQQKAGRITNTFIPGEERSFTIISFPTPEIGPEFPKIFEEIVRINTLDTNLYEKTQQTIIDALDQGLFARIRGMGGNKTDLVVAFAELKDPANETIFENCTADVNIPVGEVFTSPMLKGTNGTLFVSGVYLEDLFYRDLELVFKDGMIDFYSCSNFETEAENKQYIRDNVLNSHATLPMGEFAIGTNTFAYVTAARYGIQDRMPILIAEKMGPHFAVGDTCYSHEEELKVYNQDGKEIIARENDCSLLREKDPEKAYFQCHTDITIPYDELGEITVICADGRTIPIIRDGRFVLPGTDFLNEPFEKTNL